MSSSKAPFLGETVTKGVCVNVFNVKYPKTSASKSLGYWVSPKKMLDEVHMNTSRGHVVYRTTWGEKIYALNLPEMFLVKYEKKAKYCLQRSNFRFAPVVSGRRSTKF